MPMAHLIKAWLVNGKSVAVPSVNARLVDVHDDNLDMRALVGNHCHGWASDIAGSDAADGLDRHGGVGWSEESERVN